MDFARYVIDNNLGSIETGYTFKELTTIEIGGKIKYFYSPNDIQNLSKAFKFINDNGLNYFIIGNGSNVLAKDDFFDGIVISLKSLPLKLELSEEDIYVSANYPSMRLSHDLCRLKLGDLSFLCGIPGLLGGAIFNNSGAFNDNIGNHIISVDYIDSNGNINKININDCNFKYRDSIFKSFDWIILGARIKVRKIDTYSKIKSYNELRKKNQPIDKKCLGSIFMNNPLIKAWEIIDGLGLRGVCVNDAQISELHTNFIINNKKASYNDVYSLINLIQKRSEYELGIKLIPEINFL